MKSEVTKKKKRKEFLLKGLISNLWVPRLWSTASIKVSETQAIGKCQRQRMSN